MEVEGVTRNLCYSSATKQLASSTSIILVKQAEEQEELWNTSCLNGRIQNIPRYYSVEQDHEDLTENAADFYNNYFGSSLLIHILRVCYLELLCKVK